MSNVGYIVLTFEAYPEGKAYVSRCRELGVASCGDTVDQAFETVHEATQEYLNAIESFGERERVFSEKGIAISRTRPRKELQVPLRVGGYASSAVLSVPTAA